MYSSPRYVRTPASIVQFLEISLYTYFHCTRLNSICFRFFRHRIFFDKTELVVMIVTDSIELFPNSAVTDMIKDIENVPDFRKQYLSHWDINAYLDSLQAKYPHLVQVKIIGYTFEKRVLKSIHISFKAESDLNETKSEIKKVKSSSSLNSTKSVRPISSFSSLIKPKNESTLNRTKHVILIDAGMHAREWCTISSALYCASQLTENFDAHKDLLNAFDFVIVPIVNADGYEYSRTFVRLTIS